MLVKADLKCFYCGCVSGEVVADTARGYRVLDYRPAGRRNGASATATAKPGTKLRCVQCDGPVFLDDIETISKFQLMQRQAVAKQTSHVA